MNNYVTGAAIKQLREKCGMTQAVLAERIGVSNKAVSKWETGKGLPDVSLLQPLAKELGVSLIELMNGEPIANKNISSNLLRSKFYVCPVCGNVIHCVGAAVISCCGIVLPALEAEEMDEEHGIRVERVEDEHYISLEHPMTKQHYISFLAFVSTDSIRLVKLYPEGDAATRLQLRGGGYIYAYCNRHGLFRLRV
ncbi:MAG: helix-turn-helix domain-containing protein [Oscillospiraceae bacterium]|nr:helix-turn-helix domain-containing protein [Oscillospiraceae bacterium]